MQLSVSPSRRHDILPWLITWVVLAAWVFAPEARRIVDARLGFNAISVISIVPLLALVPLALPLLYSDRLKRLDRGRLLLAWCWFGGFAFSLVVAIATQDALGGAYAFAEFCLPAVFGLWLATADADERRLYERVATFALWLATAVALYGIVQYTVLPSWDEAWMKAAKIVSIGVPQPFMFRPFSTLNSPGLFADFLVVALLLNLPRLRTFKPLVLAQVAVVAFVLVLTMVRSDWAGFAIGAAVYLAFSPQRMRNFTIFAGVAALGFLLVVNASTLLGNSDAGKSLTARFDTFDNLDADTSFNERQRYFGDVLTEAFETPLGVGLGTIGTAAKLGSAGATRDFDNGFVARFTEMGYFGTLCYFATLLGALGISVRRWLDLRGAAFVDARARAAAVIAVQAALFALDLSSDHHNALPGLLFWLAVALVPAAPTALAAAARADRAA